MSLREGFRKGWRFNADLVSLMNSEYCRRQIKEVFQTSNSDLESLPAYGKISYFAGMFFNTFVSGNSFPSSKSLQFGKDVDLWRKEGYLN